jgi:hypothetical protein
MKKTFLAAFLLCASSTAFAQGIIQFDWHGDQNLFQASFQVWDYQMSPNSNFEPGLFDETFTIKCPDFDFSPGTVRGTGGSPMHNGFDVNGNLMLGVQCPEPWSRVGWWASASTGVYPHINAGNDTLGISYGERGYWTWAPIPEPSTFALLGLGLLALGIKKPPTL